MELFPIFSANDTRYRKSRGSFRLMVLVAQGIASSNGLPADKSSVSQGAAHM